MMWDWLLIIVLILGAILIFVALKFPIPKRDWPFNTKNTIILLTTCLVFVLLFTMFNVLKYFIEWPNRAIVIFYLSLFLFMILIILGIFFPRGIQLYKAEQE